MTQQIRMALAGNPNTGKTTLFNALTGARQHVGNWPGVTVEKKDGVLVGHPNAILTDLPGIYSLSPYTAEEVVSRNFILNEKVDVIINIVDVTRLERNLYLSTQLLELNVPMLLVLNMMDMIEDRSHELNMQALGEKLGCDVIGICASKGQGIDQVIEHALALAQTQKKQRHLPNYQATLEKTIDKISNIIGDDGFASRWYAIKAFERDIEATSQLNLSEEKRRQIEYEIVVYEQHIGTDSESIIAENRYEFIGKIIDQVFKRTQISYRSISDRVDAIVTNRILALPIFAAVMYLVYYLSISTIGAFGTDWVNDTLFGEMIPQWAESALTALDVAPWLSALILDGMIAGVGAVLGFLPQMLVLFCCLAILEDCGYMARIAFVLDRVFRRFGLCGKSFIPILISTGCGIPGIMASRTIENDQDRRITIMTATFMPCSAKLPIIALIAGAFYPEQTWIAPAMYFVGMASIIVTGIMMKKLSFFAGMPAPFVMEMPVYHLPTIKGIVRTMYERAFAFVKRAGSLILLSTTIIWFLQSFDWQMQMVDTDASLLADIGSVLAPVFKPLGFGNWRATVASITGLLAKENLVGTLGVLYGFEEVAEDGTEFWPMLTASITPLAGFSLMIFNLLCVPCMAAVGAMRREMMSARMTWFAVIYQCVFAYALSLMIYQFGTALTTGVFTVMTFVALIPLLVICYMLFIKKPPTTSLKTIHDSVKGVQSCQQ